MHVAHSVIYLIVFRDMKVNGVVGFGAEETGELLDGASAELQNSRMFPFVVRSGTGRQ